MDGCLAAWGITSDSIQENPVGPIHNVANFHHHISVQCGNTGGKFGAALHGRVCRQISYNLRGRLERLASDTIPQFLPAQSQVPCFVHKCHHDDVQRISLLYQTQRGFENYSTVQEGQNRLIKLVYWVVKSSPIYYR
jgi:hypothetical protein